MKIRNGFVSNSSSSSFVLKKDEYFPDSYSLAASMIKIREWEEDDKLVKKLINNVNKGEGYHNIAFRSCNYDTYIVEEGDYLLCETCNNHGHWSITDYGDCVDFRSLPENIREKYSDSDDDYYMNLTGKYSSNHGETFWFIEDDIIAELAIGKSGENWEDTHCIDCGRDYVVIDDVAQCPKCGKTND